MKEVKVECDSLEELEKFINDNIDCGFFTTGGSNEKFHIRFHEAKLSSNGRVLKILYSEFGSDHQYPAAYSEHHLYELDLTMQVIESELETFEEMVKRKQEVIFRSLK